MHLYAVYVRFSDGARFPLGLYQTLAAAKDRADKDIKAGREEDEYRHWVWAMPDENNPDIIRRGKYRIKAI